MLSGCTFVSSGVIAISDDRPGRAVGETENDVAHVAAPVLKRYGLEPVWSGKEKSGPCISTRGCTWAPEGKGWLQPWATIIRSSSGRVKVQIEARHDFPIHDINVNAATEDLAEALRARFGSENVVVETAYQDAVN